MYESESMPTAEPDYSRRADSVANILLFAILSPTGDLACFISYVIRISIDRVPITR